MDALQMLYDNYKAENGSFLFYLHEEGHFDEKELSKLCGCISTLCRTHLEDRFVSFQIQFIYGQVLKHILYHFDPQDRSKIFDLPSDYNEKLEPLECAVMQFFGVNANLPG